MSEVVLSAAAMQKTFRQGEYAVAVLLGIDIDVARGETVAIVGASGSGKSTLLHLLGGLDAASAGLVTVLGHRLDSLNEKDKGRLRNRALGFVLPVPPPFAGVHALENVAMPLLIRRLNRRCGEARGRDSKTSGAGRAHDAHAGRTIRR